MLPAADQFGGGGQHLGEPRIARVQGGPDAPVAGPGLRAASLRRAEAPADIDDMSQAEQLAVVGVQVGAPGLGLCGAHAVLLQPPRAHHHQFRGEQRAHGGDRETTRMVEIALQLVKPHQRPCRRRAGERPDRVRVARVHQPPLRKHCPDRLEQGPGLTHRRIALEQDEPAPLGGGGERRA
jgi:hypothetical protein